MRSIFYYSWYQTSSRASSAQVLLISVYEECDKFSSRDLFLRWFSMGLYTFSFQYLFQQSFTFTYITDHCLRTLLCSLFLSFLLNSFQLSDSPFYIIGLTLLREMFTRGSLSLTHIMQNNFPARHICAV